MRVLDGFLNKDDLGNTVLDVYIDGPVRGRALKDRLNLLISSLPADASWPSHQLAYERDLLRPVVDLLARTLGEEWLDYTLVADGDEAWYAEGFMLEGLGLPKLVGEVEVGGDDFWVFR